MFTSRLTPSDVLMVWHTHMLNPRAYLEDSILYGFRHLWASGMPWELVHRVIDTNFSYNVSDETKAQWVAKTGRAWENADDPLVKDMSCPRCGTHLQVPWTTCSRPEDIKWEGVTPDLIGNGYGDGNLQYACANCGIMICKELLCVSKFVADARCLIGPDNRPMPGTVLDPLTGRPEPLTGNSSQKLRQPRTFPNRLLKSGCNSIRTKIVDLITSGPAQPTMQHVRAEIEKIVADRNLVRTVDGVAWAPGTNKYRLPPKSRVCVRKMMSRYWDNFSPFALDLCAAVMRQGIFAEKMAKLDWLHSPTARATMDRLLIKYDRFITLMAENPKHVAVPTLDIDLAWHTSQLSPVSYYDATVAKTSRFIDHDDKIDEDALSTHFEWTSKAYQDKYGEVYSECTCWYCEGLSLSAAHDGNTSEDI